jgi:UDP-glucose 4-epimerase
MFHALYQVPVIIAKIAQAYGPGQLDYTKLIPHVTRSILLGEPPKLSSGVRLADWIYVDDVVDGLIGCAQAPGIEGRTVELGSGELHSIREIVGQLADLIPSPVDPLFGALSERPLERARKADIAHSYKLIGWRPSTALGAGLTRTVEWYKIKLNSSGTESI